MKIEVQFVGDSIDVDIYEGAHIQWGKGEGGLLDIYVGTLQATNRVASYPEGRVVRIRVVESP